ncbi:hypothetical protein [Amycolatopsis plumensis]|uniref:TniQ protein n=1 Tax=Amycolatopsis plumensis TaxID=236508 RepID=A0ABV5U8E1_9PSEU
MSATTVLLTLPTDVVQRACRSAVEVSVAAVAAFPSLVGSAGTLGDYLRTYQAVAHEGELRPCPWCQHEGHWIRWRAYPVLDPGPCPPGDVLTEPVEGCRCCLWGRGPLRIAEPLLDRLRREAHDDRDIHIDHLGRDGRWTKFETRF